MDLYKNHIRKICDKHSILDYYRIQELLMIKDPIVTLVMLSYRRPNSLFDALQKHLDNDTPLNICLNVQGCEELTKTQINRIENLVDQFDGSYLVFTVGNLGSGIPRHKMFSKALTEFNTPYIMTTDDDMKWPKYSIISQISVLKYLSKYGAIGSVCKPGYPAYIISNNKLSGKPVSNEFVNTDAMGSATTIYKREVFDTCEYDREYTIGLGDFDLCMQMKSKGHNLGIMNIPELNSLNDWDASAKDYIKERYNKTHISNSRKRFQRKWGIQG